jgi:hypothetical protein
MQKEQMIEQIPIKLGSGVLGAQMERHNSLVASFPLITLLLLYSLRPYSSTIL